jgi:YHS domain-containing protein
MLPHYPRKLLQQIMLLALLLASTVVVSALAAPNEESQPKNTEPGSKTNPGLLEPFNSVVGSWRGIGQPKRGSRRGAWQETTVCRWDFTDDHPSIRFDADKGKQYEALTLTIEPGSKQLVLTQHIDKETTRTYHGPLPAKWPQKLQLTTEPDETGVSYRCTIEQLKDIRLVLLFERRTGLKGSYRRVAGIGYTRSGHKLAEGNGNQRECIVTGGQGSIAVSHKGKTWYVCCEGCRQAFDDDPDEIIAAYLDRKN